MRNYELLIPGPVAVDNVDDAVLEALAQPVPAHYGSEWVEVYQNAVASLKQVFQTKTDHVLAVYTFFTLWQSIGNLQMTG